MEAVRPALAPGATSERLSTKAPEARSENLPSHAPFGQWGQVCRLGLASRGNTNLAACDVLWAIEQGINVVNWCGHSVGVRDAVRLLGTRRREVMLTIQLESRTAREAHRELDQRCQQLATDYIDLVTYYYLESIDEWHQIAGPGGAASALQVAKRAGQVRAVGVTSHQRPLVSELLANVSLDAVMVRYNAAHRGAASHVFPLAHRQTIPVIVYTALRWGKLLQNTPRDPPGFVPPTAPECYRFVLADPRISVVLIAPDTRAELEENLGILADWRAPTAEETTKLLAHGDRVRQSAGEFP